MFKFLFSKQYISSLWMGAVIMGLVYLFALKQPNESSAFIVGQVVLGLAGLGREFYLIKFTKK